jgi:hypothetical protein
MDFLDGQAEENSTEEQIFLAISYLNNRFSELIKIDFSNITIEGLIEEFSELRNKVIEKKNDGQYRTKEVRELFNTFIGMCDGEGYIYNITKLTAEGIRDEDFDNRDIAFVEEIANLVLQFSGMLFLKDLEGLDDFPLKLLELYEKLYFLYFKSFGIEGSLDNFFGIYYNLFFGNPSKIKLPENIDANSNQTFKYELKAGEMFDENINGNSAYFNFQFNILDKKYFQEEFTFDSWFIKECRETVVSIPIDEERFPTLAKAYRTKSPNDLPQYWANNYYEDKKNSKYNNVPIFNANDYFLISDEYERIWNEWSNQFFNSYQQRIEKFYEFVNISSSSEYSSDTGIYGDELQEGFVYLIRNQDIFKIGITENLLNRMSQLEPDEIIDVIKCSNFRELEKDLHREYKECRIPQTEYFRLDENQLIEVSKKFKLWAK